MTAVINLHEFREQRAALVLVLVDMHDEAADGARNSAEWRQALANCRAALDHARSRGFPVAFTRQIAAAATLWDAPNYPQWLSGFAPTRVDMVFDRQMPSCYASREFAEMADRIGGQYVIAGLFGEGACLSTAIDAFHREHRITFLADASASRARKDVSADTMHKAVSGIMSLYAQVGGTQPWIHATSSMGAGRAGAGG